MKKQRSPAKPDPTPPGKKRHFPLVVVSGPTASGKNVIVRALKKRLPIRRIVTMTTRKKRKGERNHIDYHFVTEKTFLRHRKEKRLLEWAKVHSGYYGVSREAVDRAQRGSKIPLLVIDVQGGKHIKKVRPSTFLLFIHPTPLPTYYARIRRDRGHEPDFKKRLESIKKELRAARSYDSIVKNEEGKLQKTIDNVEYVLRKHIVKKD